MKKQHALFVVKNFAPWRTEPNTTRMVKHLARLGWQVDVVHALPGLGASLHAVTYDPALRAELPPEVHTFGVPVNNWPRAFRQLLSGHSPRPDPRNAGGAPWRNLRDVSALGRWLRAFINIPDFERSWVLPGLWRTLQMINRLRPSVLVSSAPPFSTNLIGYLARRVTGIPWVSYNRDLFTDNPHYEPWGRWRRGLDRCLERHVLGSADGVVTVYPECTERLRRRYGRSGQIYQTIRNGYDEELFRLAMPEVNDRFTILYTGRLAFDEREGLTGHTLLRGFAQWMYRRPELRERVRLRLVGAIHPDYRNLIAELELEGVVTLELPRPQNTMPGLQMGADVLVLVLDDGPGTGPITGGKIYEYLCAGRPILGVMPDNAAAHLFTTLRVGQTTGYRDQDATAAALDSMYSAISSGSYAYGGEERDRFVAETSFAALAARFGRLMADVIHG